MANWRIFGQIFYFCLSVSDSNMKISNFKIDEIMNFQHLNYQNTDINMRYIHTVHNGQKGVLTIH